MKRQDSMLRLCMRRTEESFFQTSVMSGAGLMHRDTLQQDVMRISKDTSKKSQNQSGRDGSLNIEISNNESISEGSSVSSADQSKLHRQRNTSCFGTPSKKENAKKSILKKRSPMDNAMLRLGGKVVPQLQPFIEDCDQVPATENRVTFSPAKSKSRYADED